VHNSYNVDGIKPVIALKPMKLLSFHFMTITCSLQLLLLLLSLFTFIIVYQEHNVIVNKQET